MGKFALFAAMLACTAALAFAGGSAVFQTGAYDNVVVAIKDSVSPVNCKAIVNNIEVSLTFHVISIQYVPPRVSCL